MTGQPAPDHNGESIQTRIAADEARVLGQTPTTIEGSGQQLDLIAAPVPLLAQAHELRGRDVVLVLAAGSRVDGRLVAVDDEALLLTVEDRAYRYFVDLQSVAALAVER